MCYYIGSISVTFPCFLHFSVYPFQRHVLFPFPWHLVCPSISQALPLHMIVPCACWNSPLDETQGYVFAILRYFKIFTPIWMFGIFFCLTEPAELVGQGPVINRANTSIFSAD